MAGAERAEQLFDVRDRARPRGESGQGATTSDDRDQRRQREQRGAPSPLGRAAVGWEGQRVLLAVSQGLRRHPTTGILNEFPEWSASRRIVCPLV